MRTRGGCRSSVVARCWTRDTLLALFFVLASLILYGVTAAPSVATLFDDSLEFQVVLPTLGIAHPSGYPLYTLLGKLFTFLLPFRDPAGRVNLFSALAAAVAMGLFYLVAQWLAISRPAAIVATVALVISSAWWSQATIAEVYALHGLLVALFLYLLLGWEEGKTIGHPPTPNLGGIAGAPGGDSVAVKQVGGKSPPSSGGLGGGVVGTGADCCLAAAALVAGLGLAHHRMIALLFPAALVFILWTDPTLLRQPRRWTRPILLGLAPLLLYLYLPLRGRVVSSLDGTFTPTLNGTLNWILARGYSVFLTGNPFGVSRDAGFFVDLFLSQFGVLFSLAALLGLATAWRVWPRRYVFLLLATVAQVGFGLAYKVEDVAVFFIPAFMLVALWAAWGLALLFKQLESLAVRHRSYVTRYPSLVTGLLVVILLVEPVGNAIRAFPKQDRSHAWQVYDYGQDMLTNVAPGGQVVGLLGETTLLRYFRDVLGRRPDITMVPADAEADRFAAADAALAGGTPVYLTRDLPGAATRYSLDAAGPLIAVSPKATPTAAPPGQPVGAGIELVNAQSRVRHPRGKPVARLTLTWVATRPVDEGLKISARLLDQAGQVVVADDRVPVHFAYPTTAWVPGEEVVDVYDLALPDNMPAGSYGVLLILYRAADGSEVGRVELPPVVMQ